MGVAQLVRRHLPAGGQDVLRRLADALSPRRRAERHRTRAGAVKSVEVSREVSPDGRVLRGPFRGMWLPFNASWGGLGARLAGTYELEVVPELEKLIARQPPLVVDVGASEGYYAVGLARALPSSKVIAFDIDPEAQRLCRLTARKNGVHNIEVRGRATPRVLGRLLTPDALLVMDVEGYEMSLLDPSEIPILRHVCILVELHEFAVPGLTEAITARFAESHQISLVDARSRRGEEFPQLNHLDSRRANEVVQEGRPSLPWPQQWAIMLPVAP